MNRSEPKQILTFSCSGVHYGIDVSFIQEVLRYQNLTRVPLAHPCVAGLMNLRGSIVTTLDLATRLELVPGPQPSSDTMCLIVNVGDEVVSILVDSVADVVEIDKLRYHSAPSPLPSNLARFVIGVYQRNDTDIVHLDPEHLCNLAEYEEGDEASTYS